MAKSKIGPGLPLIASIALLAVIIIWQYIAVTSANGGDFTYALDDPYIHLAFAKNLQNFHYGINLNEFSAPSSSIIWTFVLAPFASFLLSPLIINFILSVITLIFFNKTLDLLFDIKNKKYKNAYLTTLMIMLVPAANFTWLIMTGMEHALQVMSVAMIIYGTVRYIKKGKIGFMLPAALVLAPLVRYEDMTVVLSVLLFLLLCREIKTVFVVLGLIILTLGGFSVFLMTLGLAPMPNSILAKSGMFFKLLSALSLTSVPAASLIMSVVSPNNSAIAIDNNSLNYFFTKLNNMFFQNIKSFLLSAGALVILSYTLITKGLSIKKKLALSSLFGIAVHLAVGQYGWLNRYGMYIWVFMIFIVIFLTSDIITKAINDPQNKGRIKSIITVTVLLFVFTCKNYITDITFIPFVAHNIHAQQYQMHKFVTEYYKAPVAVNDLGYVSYENDNYVLDLWGLASGEALYLRKNAEDNRWMEKITRKKGVKLAMIYETWFIKAPEEWEKVADLTLDEAPYFAKGNKTVSFFATDSSAYEKIRKDLVSFKLAMQQEYQHTMKIYEKEE